MGRADISTTRPILRSKATALPRSLEAAVVRTLAYADIFHYPLTAEEIHRYLIGLPVRLEQVKAFLTGSCTSKRVQQSARGFYTLTGRQELVSLRRSRSRAAANLWPQARAWGRLLARLPYVRMVAVTGALAVNNAKSGDDIDYLIVTAPGRLWLCRALAISLVRAASLQSIRLCPNYFVSTRALVFEQRSLYSAHELAQMVPLSGLQVYAEMRRRNAWVLAYLPNAAGPPFPTRLNDSPRPVGRPKMLTELLLQSRVGELIERWERERKIQKFLEQAGEGAEVSFSPDWCKGHFDHHGQDALAAYQARLQQLNLPSEFYLQE